MVSYRIEDITGASLSGTSGTTGRTYTLAYSGALSAAFFAQVQGVTLTQFYDFTVSGNVITFNTVIDDAFVIVLNYLTDVSGSGGSSSGTNYTTASLVAGEVRADTAFGSTTIPTLAQVYTWIQEDSAVIDLMTGELYSSNAVSSSYVDYDGSDIFRFPKYPVIGVSKIEYNVNSAGTTPSWVTLEEGFDKNYLLYAEEGEVEFISGVNATHKVTPLAGKKKLRISYEYGSETIPFDIQKLATLMVAKRVILSLINSQSNEEGGAIQVGTISVSDPSNYSVNYIKTLNAEIDNLTKAAGRNFSTYRHSRVYD